MGWKRQVLNCVNRGMKFAGVQLVPNTDAAQLQVLHAHIDLYQEPRFRIGAATFTSFAHRFNCGWPDFAWCTERTVELAIADRWLDAVPTERVTEVGAVTPYYWPRRVTEILDPTDQHPLVTTRDSIFDVSLVGRAVLSISTFEHIGIGDYGLPKAESEASRALDKLVAESPAFLVTFANNYNLALDRYVLDQWAVPSDVDLFLIARDERGFGWNGRPAKLESMRPYRSGRGGSVVVLHRGTNLFREPPAL